VRSSRVRPLPALWRADSHTPRLPPLRGEGGCKRGKHRPRLRRLGHEPTGKSFEVDHIHIYRLEGDRIAEHWGVRDDLGTLRQLGHLG